MIDYLFQDWKANSGNLKGRFIMFNFRLVSWLSKNVVFRVFGLPFLLYYKFYIQWVMGIEIRIGANLGRNCQMNHGQSIVINQNVTIGKNCVLRHGVTIGNKILSNGIESDSPIIGDHVEFGANSIVIGSVKVGDNAKIGAGVVITKNVPDNASVVSASNRYLL